MVKADGTGVDHGSSRGRATGKGACGEDDGVAGAASPGSAHSHPWTLLYLLWRIRLLVLGADDAAALYRLEHLACQLVWDADLRRRPGRNVVVGLELGSHRGTPLALRDPAISGRARSH